MPESIGETLKEARRRLGLRVKDVAGRTSARISASYLSCIENDLRLPSEELLLELAELLGLDRRELYLRLVRGKAPADIRDELFATGTSEEPRLAEMKRLTLAQLLDRAAEAGEARREIKELRREIARRERDAGAGPAASDPAARWRADLERYRMVIEKTSIEATLSLEGDATLIRHVIGLQPRPCRPGLVSMQHTARVPVEGGASDDGFKLLEQPADLGVELERKHMGSGHTALRLIFPDGFTWEKGKDRRVSYVFRSVLKGAYSLERRSPERSSDSLSDDHGDRASLVIAVDKPCEELEVDVRFPRYYVPEDIAAWAGTQDLYEAQDNLIDAGVAVSWSLETRDDWRASLKVSRPQVGMKFGITWRPLYKDEFQKFRERLELESEERKK